MDGSGGMPNEESEEDIRRQKSGRGKGGQNELSQKEKAVTGWEGRVRGERKRESSNRAGSC